MVVDSLQQSALSLKMSVRQFLEVSQVLNIFNLWPKLMACLWSFIQIMLLRNFFRGSMVFLMLVKLIIRLTKTTFLISYARSFWRVSEENIEISAKYLKRMKAIETGIEIELGVTGGEEDGVDNTDIDNSKLYTQPEDVKLCLHSLKRSFPNSCHGRLFWKCSRCL